MIAGERILLCSTHLGSFEVLGYLIDTHGHVINSLVYGGEAAVMQQNRMLLFEKQNVKLIPIMDDMSHIFALKDAIFNGETVSTYCDRSMDEHRMLEIDFMGKKAPFPMGPFQIATKFKMYCLSVIVVKENSYTYKAYVDRIEGNSAEEKVKAYADIVSKHLKRYPHQWFNFYPFWNDKTNSDSIGQ